MKEKNKKEFKSILKNKNGITLIALVITIIVMLILVGVTINMVVHGGLFQYAGNATKETELAKQKELELSNIESGKDYDYLIDKYTKDETGGDVLTANQEYTDTNGAKAVIPKGFKLTSAKTIANGLVIEDKAGNQFVWIPVTVTGTTDAEKEASFDAIRTTKNDSNYAEPASGDETEYNLMRTSVIKNGGFYIARYEAGYSMTEGRLRTNSSTVVTPLSKKGAYPYNVVNWSNAKSASQGMYNDRTKYGVKSTLCYGVQWDAMLSFLGKTGETDSTAWGNYYNAEPFDFAGEYYKYDNDEWESDKTSKAKDEYMLLQTGAADRNSLKNIYDVAGNVCEWTMEADDFSDRVTRGGSCYSAGDLTPASDRRYSPTNSRHSIGFRPTLYIS